LLLARGICQGQRSLSPRTTTGHAARIAACADGGEILVPEAVRHLAGKPYRFRDHGENVLKGFDEPVHLYRVDWAQSGT
jgi:class 3 adenylate cyclase